MAQIDAEKKALERSMDIIWKKFEGLVAPLWKVDEHLYPVFNQVSELYAELEGIRTQPVGPERLSSVTRIQMKLADIENAHRVNGAWARSDESPFPGGQALLNGRVEQCYKLAHALIAQEPDMDPSLKGLERQITHVMGELQHLEDGARLGFPVDPILLNDYQKQLDLLDSQSTEGVFKNDSGGIPEGQAALRDLLESAYEIIDALLVRVDDKEIANASVQARVTEALQSLKSSILTPSRAESLSSVFHEASDSVKVALSNPQETLDKASTSLSRLTRSGLSSLGHFFASMEPVPESLSSIQKELESHRKSLLDLRKEINSAAGSQGGIKDVTPFLGRLEKVHSALDLVDNGRKEGLFVPSGAVSPPSRIGQAHLRLQLDECYCLVYELQNRLCAK
jgi:hypothetical protein